MRFWISTVVLAAAAALAVGCSGAEVAAVPAAAPSAAPTTSAGNDGAVNMPGYVARAQWFDGPWPLTVPDGVLSCQQAGTAGKVVTLANGGVTYALNGSAQASGRFADMTAIWRDDPTNTDTKVDLEPLLRRALALC